MPGSGPLTIEGSPSPPALGTPAPRRPAMRAAGRPSAVLPVSRLIPAALATFPESRVVWAVSGPAEPLSPRAVHLRRFAPSFRPRLLGVALKPLTPRPRHSVDGATDPRGEAGRPAPCVQLCPRILLRGELRASSAPRPKVRRWPRVAGSAPWPRRDARPPRAERPSVMKSVPASVFRGAPALQAFRCVPQDVAERVLDAPPASRPASRTLPVSRLSPFKQSIRIASNASRYRSRMAVKESPSSQE